MTKLLIKLDGRKLTAVYKKIFTLVKCESQKEYIRLDGYVIEFAFLPNDLLAAVLALNDKIETL